MARVQVPSSASSNAKRGLAWYADGLAGGGLTDGTVREAREMAAGSVSEDKVRRMSAWFARHLVDLSRPQNSNPDHKDYPGPGAVAWALWGGNPTNHEQTHFWADAKVAALDREASAPTRTGEPKPNESESGYNARQGGPLAMSNPTGKNQYSKGGGTVAHGGSRRGVSGLSPAKASAVGKNLADKGWQRASTGAPGISRYSKGTKRILVDRNPFGQRMGGASVTRQFGAPNAMERYYNARQAPEAFANPTGRNQYSKGTNQLGGGSNKTQNTYTKGGSSSQGAWSGTKRQGAGATGLSAKKMAAVAGTLKRKGYTKDGNAFTKGKTTVVVRSGSVLRRGSGRDLS